MDDSIALLGGRISISDYRCIAFYVTRSQRIVRPRSSNWQSLGKAEGGSPFTRLNASRPSL